MFISYHIITLKPRILIGIIIIGLNLLNNGKSTWSLFYYYNLRKVETEDSFNVVKSYKFVQHTNRLG